MLATYMRRMRRNNLEIRIAGDMYTLQVKMKFKSGFFCLLALLIHELGLGDEIGNQPKFKNLNQNLILICNIIMYSVGLTSGKHNVI